MQETGTDNMVDIVNKFVDYEDDNYKLFKHINSLRDESESL